MPDYSNLGAEEAVSDFLKRIAHYEKVYSEAMCDKADASLSFIKLKNGGEDAGSTT